MRIFSPNCLACGRDDKMVLLKPHESFTSLGVWCNIGDLDMQVCEGCWAVSRGEDIQLWPLGRTECGVGGLPGGFLAVDLGEPDRERTGS